MTDAYYGLNGELAKKGTKRETGWAKLSGLPRNKAVVLLHFEYGRQFQRAG